MISRIWHGWTTPANADADEALRRSEIFEGIQNRDITRSLWRVTLHVASFLHDGDESVPRRGQRVGIPRIQVP